MKALRILDLEDSPLDMELVQAELTEGGIDCEITRVETREEFVVALESGDFDLILADYTLPSFDGLSALKIAQDMHPEVPFIIVSGTLGEEMAIDALKSGATDYVLKQRLEGIVPAVRRAVREAQERKGRRRTERALKESEELYRAVVQQAAENIFIVDIETKRILEANAALSRSLGYAPGELREMTLYDIVAHDRESVDRNVKSVMAERQQVLGERRYRRKDGSLIDVEVNVSVIPYGGTDAMCVVSHDVTERKRAEDALRESEERFRATFEQAPVGIAHVNLGGRWLRVNDKLCEILGYSREELSGLTFQDITHPEDLQADLDHLRRFLAGEIGTYSTEKRYFRKDGSLVWIYLTVSAMRDPSGHLKYFISITEDITERKRAEEALLQSEDRYRAVVEQAAEGIFLFDTQSKRILETNPAFQKLLGYSAEELERMTVYELVPDDPQSVDRNVQRNLAQGYLFIGERPYRRRDGSMVAVEGSGSVISYGGREVLCVVARDITERKRAQEALQEIREAERNRMARDLHDGVLQDLSYTAAAMEVTKVKAEGTGLEEELDQEMSAVRHAVRALRGAVYDLRLGEASDQPLPRQLQSLVEQNRRMSPSLDIRLAVGHDFPSTPFGTRGTELLRIVQEALTNARRHSAARHARIRLGATEGEIRVEISDDGKGFDPDATSAGIGLKSMRERVAALDGKLAVESEPGKGTRVCLWAPLPS